MLLDPRDRQALLKRLNDEAELSRRCSSASLLAYLNRVVIDCPPEPRPLREVWEPWQWSLAARLIPALECVAGVRPDQDYRGPRSFWLTLPRGHDKTSLIGRLTSWVLAFSRKPIRAVAAAADREQASLIPEFMQGEVRLNPWLAELLRFSSWRVDGHRGSRLKVLAADDKSSFGLKEDLMLLDELTNWPKRGLWDTVVSGREKRPSSVLIIITNAGLLRTWQRDCFEVARASADWYVYESPGKLAGWMSDRKLAELRRLVPPGLARRLYDNVWTDPSAEHGFVTYEEARACVDHSLAYSPRGRPGLVYTASVDYAPVRDRTVMCVAHDDPQTGEVVLDRMDVIQGSAQRRVPVQAVEAWVEEVRHAFFRPTLVLDPYQMESTAQKYDGTLEVVRFEARGGKSNYELASNLRSLVVNGRLRVYPAAGSLLVDGRPEDLVDEMAKLVVVQKNYGWRLDHTVNEHDDRTVALGQAALHIVRGQGRINLPSSERWF